VPTAIYVAAIPYLGIYVSSALLIIAFMMWLGKYPWLVAVPIGVVVPILVFLMFEIWFLVPLPKGPVEKLLGF
jgi:putative tricarboxylic transport membrane protein